MSVHGAMKWAGPAAVCVAAEAGPAAIARPDEEERRKQACLPSADLPSADPPSSCEARTKEARRREKAPRTQKKL